MTDRSRMRVLPESGFLNSFHRTLLDGGIAAAALQRPYSWTSDDVEDFFESLLKGWPVGSFTTWSTWGKADDIGCKPRLGPVIHPIGRKPDKLLLDGQHRLSTYAWALSDPKDWPDPATLDSVERKVWASGHTLVMDIPARRIRFVQADQMVPGVHLPTSVLHGVRLWPAIRKLPVEISDDDLHWITDICEVAFRECRIGTVDIESGDASDAAHVFRLINKAGQPVSDQDIERAFGIQAVVSRAVDPEVFLACARRHGEDTSEPDHEIGDLIAILRASVDVLTVEQKKALPDTPIMRHLAGPERRPLEVIDIEDMIRTVIPMLSPTQIARFMSDQSVLAVLESVVIGDMDIDADTPWWTLYSNVVAMVSGESDSLPSP